MSGSPPPDGDDPHPPAEPSAASPAPSPRPSRTASAYRWQAAIAAAIAAVATVVAAVISTSGGSGDKPRDSGNPGINSSAANHAQPVVTFTSWSEKPAKPPGKEYEFEGRVSDLPANYTVHVIIEVPRYGPRSPGASSPEPVGTEWLVSPAADVLRDGRWKLAWEVAHPPTGGRWVVVVLGDCAACTGAPASVGGLKANGPRDVQVAATATAPATPVE